jgi:hypothetical protein
MKKLVAAVALAALAAGPVATGPITAASADPLGPPVVEGSWYNDILFGSSITGTMEMLWGCTAMATGDVVASTGVTCVLKQDGVVIDTTAIATEGNATVTVPRVTTMPIGGFEICWEARSLGRDGVLYYDVTEPNCFS